MKRGDETDRGSRGGRRVDPPVHPASEGDERGAASQAARTSRGAQRSRKAMRDSGMPTEILMRFRGPVDAEIGRLFAGRRELALYRMLAHHLGLDPASGRPDPAHTGKRVRAAICMLSCQVCGGDPAAAAPAAAALELTHSFTLLHDDIADRDETRRGRESVWHRWGVGQAVTAGDALFALANLAAAELARLGAPGETVSAVLRELNEATLAVCEGQHLDIAYEGRGDIAVDDYLAMVARKTAALFSAACSMGARVAGAAPPRREALAEFGRQVGLGFQIQDDVLGVWGDPAELGKPVGGDLRRGKRSLPVVHALAQPGDGGREAAARLAAGVGTDAEVEELARLMERLGSRAFCERMARECRERGLSALAQADPEPDPGADLRTLAGYLIERTR